jgi:hypothetical protein
MSCIKHDIEEEFVFQFKGKHYECIGEDREFQIEQFRFAIKDKQWTTVKNRITNQLLWGPNIREVKI